MSEELKPCPFCGILPRFVNPDESTCFCPTHHWGATLVKFWNSAWAHKRIAELERKQHLSDLNFNALEKQNTDLQARNAELEKEVKEWECDKCKYVYPGHPQTGFSCVICPRCNGNTMPRGMLEIRRLKQSNAELEKNIEFLNTPVDRLPLRYAMEDKINGLEQMADKLAGALEYYRDLDNGKNPANLPKGAICPVAYQALAAYKAFKGEK